MVWSGAASTVDLQDTFMKVTGHVFKWRDCGPLVKMDHPEGCLEDMIALQAHIR